MEFPQIYRRLSPHHLSLHHLRWAPSVTGVSLLSPMPRLQDAAALLAIEVNMYVCIPWWYGEQHPSNAEMWSTWHYKHDIMATCIPMTLLQVVQFAIDNVNQGINFVQQCKCVVTMYL